ncbi:GNAT family N-acetyltransferase [Brachybacterium sp. DNPG3]
MSRSPRTARSPRRGGPARSAASPLRGTRLVETLLAGWRPLARMDVDGFAVLRSRGVTRRANSVVPIDVPADPAALAAAVDRVEQLLALTGDAPIFRIFSPEIVGGADGHADGAGDGAWSPLESLLADRGYAAEGLSAVLELPLDPQRTPAPDARARLEVGTPGEAWEEAAWRLAPRPEADARATLHDIMAGTPAVHVALEDEERRLADGRALAVGRAAIVPVGRTSAAVLDRIAVDPEHRREGLGTAVCRSLLAGAAVQGAERALLEVEDGNAAALGLYRRLGMHRIGEYRYRVRP